MCQQQNVGYACDPRYIVNGAGLIFIWMPIVGVGTLAAIAVVYALLARSRTRLAYLAPCAALLLTAFFVWLAVTYLTNDVVMRPDLCPSGSPEWWSRF